MNKITIIAVLALALTGLLFGQSDAKAMPRARLGANSQDDPRLKDRLRDDCGDMEVHCGMNLSDAQQKKLEPLRTEHLKTMNNLHAEIENLRIDMQQALKKEDFANLKKLAKTLNDKELSMEYARIDHLQQVYKEFTPEQKEKMRGNFMNMHRHGRFQGLLQAEIENLRIDMQQALKKEDFANLKKLAKTLNDKQLTLEYARIDHLQQVYKELTPEQKENMRGGFMNMHRHGQFQGKNWNKAPLHRHGENCQDCGQHQRKADGQGKMLHRGPGNGEGLRMRAGDCEGCEDCKDRDSKPQSKQDLKATPKAEIK